LQAETSEDLKMHITRSFAHIRIDAMYWALRRFVMRTLAADEDTKLDEPLFHYLKNTGMHPKLHPKLPCPCSDGVC
jgi:hypothetical protein